MVVVLPEPAGPVTRSMAPVEPSDWANFLRPASAGAGSSRLSRDSQVEGETGEAGRRTTGAEAVERRAA